MIDFSANTAEDSHTVATLALSWAVNFVTRIFESQHRRVDYEALNISDRDVTYIRVWCWD